MPECTDAARTPWTCMLIGTFGVKCTLRSQRHIEGIGPGRLVGGRDRVSAIPGQIFEVRTLLSFEFCVRQITLLVYGRLPLEDSKLMVEVPRARMYVSQPNLLPTQQSQEVATPICSCRTNMQSLHRVLNLINACLCPFCISQECQRRRNRAAVGTGCRKQAQRDPDTN